MIRKKKKYKQRFSKACRIRAKTNSSNTKRANKFVRTLDKQNEITRLRSCNDESSKEK